MVLFPKPFPTSALGLSIFFDSWAFAFGDDENLSFHIAH